MAPHPARPAAHHRPIVQASGASLIRRSAAMAAAAVACGAAAPSDTGGRAQLGPDVAPAFVLAPTDSAQTPREASADATTPVPPIAPRLLNLARVRFFDPTRGRTIRVPANGDLQDAIDDARPGDQILLARGGIYRGSFRLPAKPRRDGRWITIRTDLGADSLPSDTRMTPADAARLRLASIVAADRNPYAVVTDTAATGYRIVEVEVTADPSRERITDLLRLGTTPRRMAQLAGDLVVDRSYVHGTPTLNVIRCVGLNGGATAVVNSTLDDCHAKGFDSIAIGGTSGPGPYKIVNNYLAGAGMGVFFGGSDPKIRNLVPSDLEIRRNHVTRPTEWQRRWTVKNLLEFKNARRVLVQANVFENNWADGQIGFALNLKSTNQSRRAPWSGTTDVAFRFNVVRNSAGGLSVVAFDNQPTVPVARVLVADNALYRIGTVLGTKNGRMLFLRGPLADVTVARNTFLHGSGAAHAVLLDADRPSKRLALVDNVFTRGRFGMFASGTGEGTPALDAAWPGSWRAEGNVMVAGNRPRGVYPTSGRGEMLVVRADGERRLAGAASWGDLSSAQASLGLRAGADLRALADSLRGVAPDFAPRVAGDRGDRAAR